MIKNYLKVAFRTLLRYRAYSIINILGLTIGLTCFFLLGLYINDELSFDQFHSKRDQIYRVNELVSQPDLEDRYISMTSPIMAEALVQDFPEVENAILIFREGQVVNKVYEQSFSERDWFVTDSKIFEIFDFKLMAGDPKTALNKPKSIVLTQKRAKSYFGDQNPMGQIVNHGRYGDLTVTGILEDIPQNSHIQFGNLVSMATRQTGLDEEDLARQQAYMKNWDEWGGRVYILLKEDASAEALEQKLAPYVKEKREDDPDFKRAVYLQALHDIHFDSERVEFGLDIENKGNLSIVYAFAAIALFIILIAGINYMNLTTAKSMYRAKEIGLRKVIGARKGQLILQFLGESLIITFLAALLAFGLSELLLNHFNLLTFKAFTLGSLLKLLPQILLISLFIGLLAGIYPALVLSNFRPILAIRGNQVHSQKKGGIRLRQVLVITQFSLSILMIVATLISLQQLYYMQSKPLGFNQEQLLVVDINSGNMRRKAKVAKAEFAKSPDVKSVTVTSRVPGEWKDITEVDIQAQGSDNQQMINSYFMGFDQDALATFGISLLKGNNFAGKDQTDSLKILINETLAKQLGWKDPIGQKVVTQSETVFQIIGVIKDFHFQSLHDRIQPLIVGHWNNPVRQTDYITARISGQHVQETIEYFTQVHAEVDPDTPIEYHFLDQQIALKYNSDRLATKIVTIGAIITILIACLGLFGLASFTLQKRQKEIAIRKVLGATLHQLFVLLSQTFIIPVVIAMFIAFPLAYYLMEQWLQNYAYRVHISWNLFLIAGLLTVVIALSTIAYQTYKSALANPADVLAQE